MITEEHLKQWLTEIVYQSNGIQKEIDPKKVIMKGINVGSTGEAWVSFEYLKEKNDTIRKLITIIERDMVNDV